MSQPPSEEFKHPHSEEESAALELLWSLMEATRGGEEVAFDDSDREAIELFALLFIRRERNRFKAAVHFVKCMLLLLSERSDTIQRQQFNSDIYLYGEVLARWTSDAAFVDENGKPRLLPTDGLGFSFVSLVKSINVRADPPAVLAYLMSIKAVERIGDHCCLLERKAKHLGPRSLSPQINFRSTVGHLRVCESHVRDGHMPEYSYTAVGRIPRDKVGDFREASSLVGDGAVLTWDEIIMRMGGDPGNTTDEVEVQAGAFVSLGDPMPSLLPKS